MDDAHVCLQGAPGISNVKDSGSLHRRRSAGVWAGLPQTKSGREAMRPRGRCVTWYRLNGRVNNGTELFGNYTPQPQPPQGKIKNGFLALAEFDKPANGGNGDGVISKRDTLFASLRLWQDLNHNGISEAYEMHSLREFDVAKLHLDYKKSKRRDEHGNWFRFLSKVKDKHDAQVGRWALDVFLVTSP